MLCDSVPGCFTAWTVRCLDGVLPGRFAPLDVSIAGLCYLPGRFTTGRQRISCNIANYKLSDLWQNRRESREMSWYRNIRRCETSRWRIVWCGSKTSRFCTSQVVKHPWIFCSAVRPQGGRSVPQKEAVTLELDRYSCSHARRGRCVIINNHHFNQLLTGQSDRIGTEVDAAAAESLFVSLGFEVMCFNDLTINDMSINLREGTVLLLLLP